MANTIIILMKSMIFIFHISFHVSLCRCDETQNITGFTVDLIHRDSPQSPFYDPSSSPTQRLVNEIRRSLVRLQARGLNVSRVAQVPEVDVIRADGDYFMKYSVGTPPTPCLGVVDTGSDIIWTQCRPCRQCFKQTLPIFNPESSSTYRRIPCNTADCERSEPYTYCSADNKDCLFSIEYLDDQATNGVLSIDTLSIASTGGTSTAIPNIVFGCGWRNDATFTSGETGIVGLGGGTHSLINQLGPLAGGRFSYCLTSRLERSTTSKLHFGDNAAVAGTGVVTIPLVRMDPRTLYHVTLLDVAVGYRRLGFSSSSSAYILEEGNMVFDSGTTLLMLPAGLYDELKHAVQDHIKLEQAKDPGGVFDLCFQKGRGEVPLPEVVLYFRGGDVILEDDNIFVEQNDQLCLAALPVWGRRGPGIFGYLAQANFLVGYDLNKGEVYLKRTDCTKL